MTGTRAEVRLANPLADPQNPSRPLFSRAGGWLFERRTIIPVPLVLSLLLFPAGESPGATAQVALGAAIVAAAEALRLWAVRQIGVISRTRSDRLGPLVSTGPFAVVRNPLYVANIALWIGFALSARLPWLAPVFLVVLSLEYHAIVRWEEELLAARRGDEYREYAARVPRWWPRLGLRSPVSSLQSPVSSHQSPVDGHRPTFSWRETLFSERGTLVAIAVGYVLLWLKSAV